MTAAQIAHEYGPSVVRITTPPMPPSATGKKKPSPLVGSGFMASRDGLIVTSLAVVQGRGMNAPRTVTVEFALRTGEYGKTTGRVLSHSERDGMALIKVDPRKMPLRPLPLGDSDSIVRNDRVTALGVQRDMSVQRATGTIAETEIVTDTFTGNGHIYALVDDLRFPSGPRSQPQAGLGGPLFNETGQVIGVVGPPGGPDGVWGKDLGSGEHTDVWADEDDLATQRAVGIWWAVRSIKSTRQHGYEYLWSKIAETLLTEVNDETFSSQYRSPLFTSTTGRLKVTWEVGPRQSNYSWAIVVFRKGQTPDNSTGVGPLLLSEAGVPDKGTRTFTVTAGKQYYLWMQIWHCEASAVVWEAR
jgi:hypothetical protein